MYLSGSITRYIKGRQYFGFEEQGVVYYFSEELVNELQTMVD